MYKKGWPVVQGGGGGRGGHCQGEGGGSMPVAKALKVRLWIKGSGLLFGGKGSWRGGGNH